MDFLKDDVNDYTLSQQRIKVLNKAIKALRANGVIPISVKMALENLSINNLNIGANASVNLENIHGVKKALMKVGFVYLILVFIGLIARLATGGSGSGSSGGGGSSGGSMGRRANELMRRFEEHMGDRDVYNQDDVLSVVSKMNTSELPEHVKKDMIQIAKLCMDTHELDAEAAHAFIKKSGHTLELLNTQLLMGSLKTFFSALFFDSKTQNGIELLADTVDAISYDIETLMPIYTQVMHNYEETMGKLLAIKDSPEFLTAKPLNGMDKLKPPQKMVSLIKRYKPNSDRRDEDFGFIGANKTFLLTALNTSYHQYLGESDMKRLARNRGHELGEIIHRHQSITRLMDSVEEFSKKQVGYLKSADEAYIKGEQSFEQLKLYLLNYGKTKEASIEAIYDAETGDELTQHLINGDNDPHRLLSDLEQIRKWVKSIDQDCIAISQFISKVTVTYMGFFGHVDTIQDRMARLNKHVKNIVDWIEP